MAAAEAPARQRLLTIGAVCRRLKADFPDISISKIRYLEDQGLLTPKRTQGGYRLFSEEDLERLQTILRLQRDEFLPLRVIREELAAGAAKARRRRSTSLGEHDDEAIDLAVLCERAGIEPVRARELEEFGLIEPRVAGGRREYSEADVEIAEVCDRLARYGIAPRHLRAFRTSADRETGLLEALVTPALRSRNPERRRAGLDDLRALTEAAQELSQLLLARNVRRLAT
jgi:DNA-binding transcriptional MerR regulator